MKLKHLLILFLIIPGCILALDIEVKKFELLEKDQTAVTSARKDVNENACGLEGCLRRNGMTAYSKMINNTPN